MKFLLFTHTKHVSHNDSKTCMRKFYFSPHSIITTQFIKFFEQSVQKQFDFRREQFEKNLLSAKYFKNI